MWRCVSQDTTKRGILITAVRHDLSVGKTWLVAGSQMRSRHNGVCKCVFLGFFLKSLQVKTAKFSMKPSAVWLSSQSWSYSLTAASSSSVFMFFPSLRRHVCSLSVSCPPPCNLFSFNHNHCLSDSHGLPKRRKKRKPKEGDCGTIHSNRMVFIFPTTVLECFHLCDQTAQKTERKKRIWREKWICYIKSV